MEHRRSATRLHCGIVSQRNQDSPLQGHITVAHEMFGPCPPVLV